MRGIARVRAITSIDHSTGDIMYKTEKTSIARALALAGVLGASFASAPIAAQEQKKVEKIEVTGSAIKRVDAEGPAPVEIITREEIRRSGAATINELLKTIPVVDINDQGELASNSPGGSGTARVRLRGLAESQTLVLVNGRRVPKNPLDDSTGAGSAFDIGQIPIAAIERVEILKDGGSAIYGADAVAGVMNFILRKDFRGADVKLTAGRSSRGDGNEEQLSVAAGFGDLDKNRFNVLVALDVLQRDPILRKDREISRSVDFRRFGPVPGFNLDGRSGFAPQGNILTSVGTFSGQTVQPCPPEDFTNNACRYDFNKSLLTAYNGADRVNGMAIGTVQLSKDITGTAQIMASRAEDHFDAHPVPDNFLLPDGRIYAGRFMQGGPRMTDRKGEFFNAQFGVDGTYKELDWSVGFSTGESKVTNRDQNYYDRPAWVAALSAGLIDATTSNNDPAFVQSLKVAPVRKGSAKLSLFDAKVSGDLFAMAGGTTRYAVGVNKWKEELSDQPDAIQQAPGGPVGSIQQTAISKTRDADAVFAELQLPITKNIEGQLAARHDKYDTASRTTPKVAVKWQMIPQFLVRASYSEAFKMPTLKQLFGNAGEGAINLTSEQCQAIGLPAGCNAPAFRVTGSNAELKPEIGKSYNLGFVADVGAFSAAVDFWRIAKEDNIATPSILFALENGFYSRDSLNRLRVFLNLQNFAQTNNTGVDVDTRLKVGKTPFGDITLRAAGIYYKHQRTRTSSNAPWAEFNATYAAPRYRHSIMATSETGPWIFQGVWRTTSGFADTVQPAENFALLPSVRRVSSFEELDLSVTYSGFKNLTLFGSIKNALDRMPPFSATNGTNNNFTQQGFAELYTSRGRFYQVSAQYQFR
jgi:iron complex outermembrane receptor protein